MLENELKNIWKNSSKEELVKFNKSKLILDLDSKLENFDKKMKIRNRAVQFGSIIFVIIGFTIVFFWEPELLTKIACLLSLPMAILQLYLIKKVKKYKVDDYSLPLKEFLLKRQQYLIKERKLFDTILYWNILPFILIFTLFILGESLSGTDLIINILLYTSVLVIGFLGSKRVVKKRFDPLIKKVEASIAELDSVE